jgi:hypothetical protein
MKRTVTTTCLVGLGLTLASPVYAQDAVLEGPGYEIGEGTVIHPSVALETGYVSNVFYEDTDPVSSAILRLVGSFTIASQGARPPGEVEPTIVSETDAPEEELPPPAKLDFRLGAQLILLGYLSDNEQAQDQSDVAGAAEAHITAFPQGDVAFSVDDLFIRDARPKNFESTGNLNRDYNHFQGGVTLQPQGRSVSLGARYENVLDRFESDKSAFANRMNHIVGLRGEWRWLPYTKLYADASLGFFDAIEDRMGFKSASTPLRVQLGLATALTEMTSIRGHIGYANAFYEERQNFQNVIGGAEFGYRYTEYGRFRLTFDYDFHDSLQANFFRDYAFLAIVDHQFGLLVAGADAGVRLRSYRGIPMEIGPADRDDVVLSAGLRLHYLVRDWLALTGRVEMTADETDYVYDAGGVMDTPEYERFEAYVGVSAAF